MCQLGLAHHGMETANQHQDTCVNCGLDPTLPHFPALSNPHLLPTLEATSLRAPKTEGDAQFIRETLGLARTAKGMILQVKARLDQLLDRAERILEYGEVSLAPIERISSDIMVLIFEKLCEDPLPDAFFGPPLSVQLVCKYWTRLVLESPQLWTNVSVYQPQDLCKAYDSLDCSTRALDRQLKLSHPLPLHVSCPTVSDGSLVLIEDCIPEHVALVSQHRERWKSVNMGSIVPVLAAQLFSSPSSPLPQLSSLALHLKPTGPIPPETLLQVEQAPKLTHVNVKVEDQYVPLNIPWSSVKRMRFRASFVDGNPHTLLSDLASIQTLDFSWTFRRSELGEPCVPRVYPTQVLLPCAKKVLLELTSNQATPDLFDQASEILEKVVRVSLAPVVEDLSVGYLNQSGLEAIGRMMSASWSPGTSSTLTKLYLCSRQATSIEVLLPALECLDRLESFRFETRTIEYMDVRPLVEALDRGLMPALQSLRLSIVTCLVTRLRDMITHRVSSKSEERRKPLSRVDLQLFNLIASREGALNEEWRLFSNEFEHVKIVVRELE